ncbi:MAG: YceI family protein [Deltaproteobacteria bacterium]|nr:YceI family protein [Deltaproteobacteria bacterium]
MKRKISEKKYFIIILALFFMGAATAAWPAQYKVDPTHSFVEFRIQHLGFSWLYGRFNDVSGAFSYDESKPGSSKFSVEIATDSVDTNHAERDKHLRGKDFLEVSKYPKASFKSKSFDGRTLEGVLTLHGVSKRIKIDVSKVGEGKDPWGGYRVGFIGKIAFKKSDFGIDYNLGPAGEMIEFDLGIEGIRK